MLNRLPDAPRPNPEDDELRLKRAELERLHDEAVAREEQLRILEAQVEGFALEHVFRLGRLYARIDELDLAIAEALLARRPDDPVLERRVQEARARLQRSREAAYQAEESGPPERVPLSDALRRRYREAARLMHPDLSRSPEEDQLRHQFMVRLNEAYRAADLDRLEEVIAAWEVQGPPVEALTVGDELVRVIRAIARLRDTLERLEREVAAVRERADCRLMVRANRAEAEGRDLLGETEDKLRAQIEDLETRLRNIEEGRVDE